MDEISIKCTVVNEENIDIVRLSAHCGYLLSNDTLRLYNEFTHSCEVISGPPHVLSLILANLQTGCTMDVLQKLFDMVDKPKKLKNIQEGLYLD